MPQCVKNQRKDIKICIGDMDKDITVYVRQLQPPAGDSVDIQESFLEARNMRAMIETVSNGQTLFDKTNVAYQLTHKFSVHWEPNITFENFILFNNEKYKILSVENQNERNKFYIIKTTIRGSIGRAVNSI